MSTQVLTELPNIQYTGMDFDSVMAEIRSILQNNPNWAENWSEFYDSEAGNLLSSLMAWVMDNMSTKQDALFNEMFLSTAFMDESKIRLLKQIGYKPKMASAAKVAIRIEFNNIPDTFVYVTRPKTSIGARIGEICKFTSKDINGESINWEVLQLLDGKPDYLNSVTLNYGEISYTLDRNGNTLYALQGETKYKEFTTDSSNGSYFDLYDENIAADSIQVYIKKTTEKLLEVNSFVSKDAIDTSLPIPYVVEYNTNKTYRIRFGNKSVCKEERLLPAGTTISVFYRVTDGRKGNISPNFINTGIKVIDDNGNTTDATVYNDLLGAGGTDAETIDDAALNGPLSLRTMDRAVTPEDYDIILSQNANIFKAKTYTATNQPNGFKSYYGRYINPQESFSIVLLNKNYKDVPASEYNNFPWISLTKEPRLNEKYVFDVASYNTNVSFSNVNYNYSVVLKDAITKNFRNAIVINCGDNFNNALYNPDGTENKYLKLKLSKKQSKENFFDDIPFDILSNNKTIAASKEITMDNSYIAIDDYAKFVTASAYDLSDPIDVSKGRYITVSIDNKTPVVIDLWVDRGKPAEGEVEATELDEEGYYKNREYYLLWKNEGEATAKAVYGLNKTKEAATHRNGIVDIINESFVQISKGEDDKFEYASGNSYQYCGLNLTSETAMITTLDTTQEYKLAFSVNGEDYTFTINTVLWEVVKAAYLYGLTPSFSWNSLKGLVYCLKYAFETEDFLKKIVNGEEVVATGTPLIDLVPMAIQVLKVDTDSLDDEDAGLDTVYNSWDLVFKTDSLLINKTYKDKEGFNHTLENVVWLEDTGLLGYDDFFHLIKGNTNLQLSAHDFIPEPTQAADYKNLASLVYTDEDRTHAYFKIQSPIKGLSSSIMFKYDSSNNDFMKTALSMYFNENGYSYKAYGVKRIFMLKEDVLRSYIVQNGTEVTLPESPRSGNLIFENSCIYNNSDFEQIYANFKTGLDGNLILGSVYENFYYSGDEYTDSLLRTDVAGIEGQYMDASVLANGVTSYTINEAKTNFDIRFTSEKVDTNSLYSIKTDLDVIASDRIKLLTNAITQPVGSPIAFQVDNYETINVDLSNCRSGSAVVAAIKKVIKDLESTSDLKKNIDTVVSSSYFVLNQVQLQNLNKNNGRFTFFYPDGIDEERVQNGYKVLFGTSATNNEFYQLYPADMFDSDNIFYEDDGETYWYCPTVDKPLEFTYRKLISNFDEENQITTYESRPADYYIKIESAMNGDQYAYKFLLCKTENSKFPDLPFYVHFVNDRTHEYDANGKIIETDETVLQNYMKKHKISGTDITFIKPYFKPYDVAATIKYNQNFPEAEVVQAVNKAIDEVCDIKYSEIAGSMSRAKILKAIMNCDGVEDCKITYFGHNYKDRKDSVDTLTADFYEILCLNDSDGSSTGKILTFEIA